MKVNCAALPADLLESELFGYERGAFTGAQVARAGKFESAHQGTILLDEIGEMPLGLQAKLLHVLQDGAFTRLGTNRTTQVDVRVIAATNRDLGTMIQAGQFREDLYYRLQVIEICVPPLRERQDEIDGLVDYFIRLYGQEYGRPVPTISVALREALNGHAWPGNVRELQNTIKRFVILQDESLILEELRRRSAVGLSTRPADLVAAAEPATTPSSGRIDADVGVKGAGRGAGRLPDAVRAATLRAEREVIQDALDHFRWNRRKAAQQLGVSYRTLRNKMESCGLKAPSAERGPEPS